MATSLELFGSDSHIAASLKRLNFACLFPLLRIIMSGHGKAGGKLKPLKKAKAADKNLTEEDIAFKNKQREEKKALDALKEKVATKGFVKTKVGK